MSQITMYADNADAMSESPFTYSQQVFKHPGERWRASVSVAPSKKEFSEPWVAFLMSLRGRSGTFLLGDPARKQSMGSALGAKKNLFLYTEKFDNAYWTKGNLTVTANTTTAPDGNSTAESVVETNATVGTHRLFRALTIPAGTYTLSTYVKPNGRNWIYIYANAGLSTAFVNISTGALGTVVGATVVATSVGDGWYRVSLTFSNVTTVSQTFQIWTASSNGVTSQTGDGVSGIYPWGVQLEAGDLTDYQPINDAYGPFVNGASQIGTSLVVDGASPSESAYLKAGDYIQLGTGLTSRLHKVLADVATNDAGQGTIDVWPRIRTAPADNATVYVENTVGLFRLSSGVTSWQIDEMSSYGITFDCVEVI